LGVTIRKISFVVGLGTLISVTISLFFASLFAVKLSLFASSFSGAIVGLVIWATYFSLLVWVSSTTVGSLVGSVVNTATSGFQALVGTAAAMIGGKAASQQVVATAEAAATAVRRELTAGFDLDPNSVRDKLEDYLEAIKPPELDLRKIRAEFEDLLKDPNLQELAQSGNLQDIDRQTLVELVSSRTDLSKREVNRIADQLEAAWKSSVKQVRQQKGSVSDFVDYLKSATRDQLLGKDLNQRIDDVVGEMRKRRESEHPGPMAQAATLGLNSLIGLVIGRTDLSDLDVEKIVGQLKTAKDQLGEQTSKVAAQISSDEKPAYSTVRADIENYLLNAYSWQMSQENAMREFRDVLYDSEADPAAIIQELEQINRSDFADLLQQRGVFTQEKIRKISTGLETVRLEVITAARAAQERERSLTLMTAVEDYLLNTQKHDFIPEKIQLNFKPILEDSEADYDQLSNRLIQLDRAYFERTLGQRADIPPLEASAIISELEIARERGLQEAQDIQAAAKAKIDQQWLKVQSYLRDTGKDELNPNAIKRELQLLLDDPQAGASALRARASRFDRDTLVQLLSQRQDLSEEQVNQILDEVENTWTRIRYA
ncbi:MAG: MFS transporter, partial [Microcystaceae cyanobacterium]